MSEQSAEPRHVDDFIDDYETDNYAAFVLGFFRQNALRQMRFGQFMKQHKLFCTREGKRYRCTGASRLGDVCLSADFNREAGYELRVAVDSCSEWGPLP